MANERISKKERSSRGAAPKISLVMTGIGTFAVLILTFIIFILNRRIVNNPGWLTNLLGLSSDSDSGDSLVSAFASGLGDFITETVSEVLLMLIVIFLICGIWCLVFWLICLKSKTHRVRDVICTIAGRLPIIILAYALLRINQDLGASDLASYLGSLSTYLGIATAILFIWAFLAILLSIFGWKKTRTGRH